MERIAFIMFMWQKFAQPQNKYTGLADENVASAKRNATVIFGNNSSALLDIDPRTYDFSKDFCYNYKYQPITIKLGKRQLINCIRFSLRYDNSREYSYKIEASLDDETYKVIVDHSHYSCRSWQDLLFPSTVVRYIRLIGTHSNDIGRAPAFEFKVIQVFGFQAMYRTKIDDLLNGFVKPSCNVATIPKARVIEGYLGDNMLNDNSEEFTWQKGNGSIIVQLSQPYWINSVGIRLGQEWRSNQYSFFIETSTNKENWTMAVDKRDEKLTGWQQFGFESRAAVFIKIVSTQPDVNLICSYFECPSGPRVSKDK